MSELEHFGGGKPAIPEAWQKWTSAVMTARKELDMKGFSAGDATRTMPRTKRCMQCERDGSLAMKHHLDDPTVAQLAEKVVKTTFAQEHQQLGLFQKYFVPGGPDVPDEPGYWWIEKRSQHLYFRVKEKWVISNSKRRMFRLATSEDLKEWVVGTGSATAPRQVLRTRAQGAQIRFRCGTLYFHLPATAEILVRVL